MTTDTSKITIHMVASLDGFIAKSDGSVEWLRSMDHYEKGKTLSDADVEAFLQTIDCYVMGARTYEHALELGWPYGNTPVVVLTHRNLSSDREHVTFYAGDLIELFDTRLKTIYMNIWVVGGAMLVKDVIRLGLADEIIVSVMPILLGGSTRFFDDVGMEQRLRLMDVTTYKDGMVELHYEIKKDDAGNL